MARYKISGCLMAAARDELLGKNIVGGDQNSIRMSGRIFFYSVRETG